MPEWLRRPPAWRDMPAKPTSPTRELPKPDMSVIDPRTLIDVSDLPTWLQAIAARGGEPRLEQTSPDHVGDSATASVAETARKQVQGTPDPSPETPSRDFAPLGAGSSSTRWPQSRLLIPLLVGALGIAVVMIILLATGTL
jgi:hypothetical protein